MTYFLELEMVISEKKEAALSPNSKKRRAEEIDVREQKKKPSTELDPTLNDDLHIHSWNRLMARIRQKEKEL